MDLAQLCSLPLHQQVEVLAGHGTVPPPHLGDPEPAWIRQLPSGQAHRLLRQRHALCFDSLLVSSATSQLWCSASIDASSDACSPGRPPRPTCGPSSSSKSDQESVGVHHLIQLTLQLAHRSQLVQKALLYLAVLVTCVGVSYLGVVSLAFLYQSTPSWQAVAFVATKSFSIVIFLVSLGILKLFSILMSIPE